MSKSYSFMSQVFIFGLGIGVNRLLWLLALPVLSSFLIAEDFGRIASLTVIGVVLRTIFGLGIFSSLGIVYFDKDTVEQRAKVIGSAVTFAASGGILLVLLSTQFATSLAERFLDNSEFHHLITLQSIAVALQLISEPMLLRLQFDKQAISYFFVAVALPIIGVPIMLILIAYFDFGILGWCVGQLINGAGQLILAAFILGKTRTISLGTFPFILQIIRFSLPLWPSVSLTYFMQYSGHYFLKELSNLEALGLYSLGFSLGMVMNLFVSAFGTAWVPYFQSFQKQQKEATGKFSQIAVFYLCALGGLVLLAFVFARPTVYLLMEPQFFDAYRVVGLIALAQALFAFWIVLQPVLYFNKRVYLISLFQGIGAVCISLCSWFLVPIFGPEGAAYGSISGGIFLILIQISYNASQQENVCAYNWRRLATSFVFTGIAIQSYRLFEQDNGIWASFGFGLFCFILLAVLSWFLILNTENKLLIKQYIRRKQSVASETK